MNIFFSLNVEWNNNGNHLFYLAWSCYSGQISPTSTKDFKKFVVIRVAGDEKNENGLSECYNVILLI